MELNSTITLHLYIMKVIFLYDSNEPINKFIEIFKELKIDIVPFSMQGKWEENKDFINLISEIEYFIVIATPKNIFSSWIKFISGYCMGNKRCLYLHLYKDNVPLPTYLYFAKTGASEEFLKDFFSKESKLWKQKMIIQCAKDELESAGLFFSVFHFFYCIRENKYDAVELYMTADMQPDVKDEQGVTGLCHAVRLNNNEIAKLLIESDCNINIQSGDNNNNALMDAAANNNTEIVRLLIELGSDLNVQSKNEQTALMLAVGRGNENNTRLLLEAGAEVEIKDVLGMTAMRYAEILKYKTLIKLFKDYQALNGKT